MSNRKGLIAQVQLPIEAIPSPNRHVPLVTADCRVYFPPNATREQVKDTLSWAYQDLVRQIDEGGPAF